MSYLVPTEFVTKMIDAGESKIFMSTRDTVIRAYMAGAILALAAAFAVTVTVQTGNPLIGAILFPVGFCMLYLMGFDLLTGVFTLAPLAVLDKRPGCTWGGVLRNWGLVFVGNFAGALTVALFMAIIGGALPRVILKPRVGPGLGLNRFKSGANPVAQAFKPGAGGGLLFAAEVVIGENAA